MHTDMALDGGTLPPKAQHAPRPPRDRKLHAHGDAMKAQITHLQAALSQRLAEICTLQKSNEALRVRDAALRLLLRVLEELTDHRGAIGGGGSSDGSTDSGGADGGGGAHLDSRLLAVISGERPAAGTRASAASAAAAAAPSAAAANGRISLEGPQDGGGSVCIKCEPGTKAESGSGGCDGHGSLETPRTSAGGDGLLARLTHLAARGSVLLLDG